MSETELQRLLELFADSVEHIALQIPPPNSYTPQFISLCNGIRREVVRQKSAAVEQATVSSRARRGGVRVEMSKPNS